MEEVPVELTPAVRSHLLPVTFLETHLYEKMHQLLSTYMAPADALFMLSEIKKDLYKGFSSFTAQELHTIVHHCRKCPALAHPPVLPSWNCTDPDLLIIAENPVSIQRYGTILFDGLKRAGFSSNRCMLTYAVRCNSEKISQQEVDNCLPYLHTEIAAVNPKLVLTLGLNSFRLLTGDTLSKLNEIRGTVRTWGLISVMPEVSLGTLHFTDEKGQGSLDSFISSLRKAHQFLYPER